MGVSLPSANYTKRETEIKKLPELKDRVEYKNPGQYGRTAHIPHGMHDLSSLWLVFEALRMEGQAAAARQNIERIYPTGIVFKFLAPNEIIETINHQWEDYECLSGRIASLAGELTKTVTEIAQPLVALKNVGGTIIKSAIPTGGTGAPVKTGQAAVNQALGTAMETAVVNYRVDTALTYKNSERRRYSLTVQLAETGNAFANVVEPVRALQALSAPTMGQGLSDIVPPYIFKIYTSPVDWLKINYAAMLDIQPNFKGPYVDGGYPSSCDLLLTFIDIEPMYDRIFNVENIIKVKTKIQDDVIKTMKTPTPTGKIY